MFPTNASLKKALPKKCFFLEAPPRFELGVKVLQTSALPLGYGAIFCFLGKVLLLLETGPFGAEDEIRTRDVHLGKVTLYH